MRVASVLVLLGLSLTAFLASALHRGSSLTNTIAPDIAGVPTVGDFLTVSDGTWTPRPASYTYQWQDCNAHGADCSNVRGATAKRYRVAGHDTLSSIRAVVTAHVAGASASASGFTGPEPAQFNWISYSGDGLSTRCSADSVKANRYQLIVLQSNEPHASRYVSCLHADNPHVKLIVYVDSIATSIGDTTDAGSCTSYTLDNDQAIAHPADPAWDWFLHDIPLSSVTLANEASSRIRLSGSSDAFLLDVGLSAYWPACASHATSVARRDGADGILWDDVICQGEYTGIESSPAYPNDASWQTAENNWASHAAASVHADKLLQIANIAGGESATCGDPAFRTDIIRNGRLDGSMEEGWTDGGAAPPGNPYGPAQQNRYWRGKLTDAIQAEASHKYYEAHNNYGSCSRMPCGNEAEDTYSLASLLMAANGYSSLNTADGQCYAACEAWWPEYNTALELGPAIGRYQTRSDSHRRTFYERDFANGIALANPSRDSIPWFSLTPGGTYSGKSCTPNSSYPTSRSTCLTLTNVSRVTLAADQGLILLKTKR
jgi:hypothetical protein